MGYDYALSLLNMDYSLTYLKGFKAPYLKRMLVGSLKRRKIEKEFDIKYRAFLANRITFNDLVRSDFENEGKNEQTKEQILNKSNLIIGKFQKKGA